MDRRKLRNRGQVAGHQSGVRAAPSSLDRNGGADVQGREVTPRNSVPNEADELGALVVASDNPTHDCDSVVLSHDLDGRDGERKIALVPAAFMYAAVSAPGTPDEQAAWAFLEPLDEFVSIEFFDVHGVSIGLTADSSRTPTGWPWKTAPMNLDQTLSEAATALRAMARLLEQANRDGRLAEQLAELAEECERQRTFGGDVSANAWATRELQRAMGHALGLSLD